MRGGNIMQQYLDRCECHIHSLDGGLAQATIIRRLGNNQYLAEYNGVRCTAIFNCFVGRYYVDDKYGIVRDAKSKGRDPVR